MPSNFIVAFKKYISVENLINLMAEFAAEFLFVENSPKYKYNYHRLNGSSSPVLTATSLSYGKAKNSTPHRIKTPDPIEIKFGRIDYVGEGTRYANPSRGGFPANG